MNNSIKKKQILNCEKILIYFLNVLDRFFYLLKYINKIITLGQHYYSIQSCHNQISVANNNKTPDFETTS